MIPPKPAARAEKVSLFRYLRLFRQDILSAQPARLYRALMAEFRTPFFRSYLCNDPALIDRILKEEPANFPKSERVGEGLMPLLGRSVFVTNGAEWESQRRIIDPAFEGGRLRETYPAMLAAANAAVARMQGRGNGPLEVEAEMSHAAADVIFRTLFSIPIDHAVAARVFARFRDYQRAQPLLNLAAFLPLPRWMPRFHRRSARRAARDIRRLMTDLTEERATAIHAGRAPDDLATKIMTTPDPQTGRCFSPAEMVDQVAIFFLAGHETSASALAWALYLLALFPDVQTRARAEAQALPENPTFSDISRLGFLRDIFRETLRLYPPVPMMVRENRCPVEFRGRDIAPGAQIVLSPWHVHRHERFWDRPDHFDPDRWQTSQGRTAARAAWFPFSSGPRVCPGAGFAMIEGPLILALLLREFRFATAGPEPVPVAHLTVRSRCGIWLSVTPAE
ncbi:MAG TPA: cytochrome P450 [Paracoccaceae bacterium]|nr:cytochrome P450 [Paracoccaceae bacterium]